MGTTQLAPSLAMMNAWEPSKAEMPAASKRRRSSRRSIGMSSEVKKAALGQQYIASFSAEREMIRSWVECQSNSSTKLASLAVSIDGGRRGLDATKRQIVKSPLLLTKPNRARDCEVAWLVLMHRISAECCSGSDVIICPVDVENAKTWRRPSGIIATNIEGETATVSEDNRSHLTRESLIRGIGRPS